MHFEDRELFGRGALHQQAADVLPDDAEAQQDAAANQHDQYRKRGPSLDRCAVEHCIERQDARDDDAREAGQHTQCGGQPQRDAGMVDEQVRREFQQLPQRVRACPMPALVVGDIDVGDAIQGDEPEEQCRQVSLDAR